METNFEVKENSLQEFADKWFVNHDSRMSDTRDRISPYSILGADKIYVKKSFSVANENKNTVTFELTDKSRLTNSELIHTYTYDINYYDDISLCLELSDFKVTTKWQKK